MDIIIIYLLIALIFIVTFCVFMYIKEKDKQAIIASMRNIYPDARNMEIDFKWLNHLVEKECTNIKNIVLYPRHRNKGGFSMITDDVYNEAIILTSKNVLKRLSDEQFKILSFYVGSKDDVQEYIVSVISEHLRDEVDKLNSKVVNKLK